MNHFTKRLLSVCLSILMLISVFPMEFSSSALGASPIIIQDEKGVEITTRQTIKEYDTVQLKYATVDPMPADATVVWSSNLPLLADVDSTGKVKGYDYSKSAIIQLWLDENVRILPLVGNAMADSIMDSIKKQGVDLDNMNNDVIVGIVRAIAGDTLANSLKNTLDNMNVEITVTLLDAAGKALGKDTVEFVVEKDPFADAIPTGAHITNRKVVPTKVAVGTTVQLRGAITPVRLHHNLKWSITTGGLSFGEKKHATVTDTGLVTFTSPGKVTVRLASATDRVVATTMTFDVFSTADLPVQSFDIVGTTEVKEGGTTQLGIANVVPAGAYTGDLTWATADPTIAVIDGNGVATGLDGGSGYTEYSKTTKITATAGGVSKTIDLKVTRAGVTGDLSSVSISGPDALAIGNSAQYTADVIPARLNENKSLLREWGILHRETGEILWAKEGIPSENTYLSIDSTGMVTAIASGKATIVAKTTLNGKSLEYQKEITVGKAIENFTITGKTSVVEGKKTQLSISNILPADYDQVILDNAEWKSSNTSIAIVSPTGLVTGLDCGGNTIGYKKTATITVTVGGLSKSVEITVKNGGLVDYYTGGEIVGTDYIIKDFPVSFSSVFTPARVGNNRQYWGVVKDDGSAPWKSSITMGGSALNKFKGNMENSNLKVEASVDGKATTGKMIGKTAGKTTVYTYMNNIVDYQDLTKEVTVVEIDPESIAIVPPTTTEYVEGNTALDLNGMQVKLTYRREDIAKYYGEEKANQYTDEQLTVPVTDYVVGEINPNILDAVQYILVTVTRAGKQYNTVFPVTVKSKEVTSIELQNPQYKYIEGVKALNLTDLKVKANYANAPSEFVTDFVVHEEEFNPNLWNEEQQITVTYTHAGRSASATFPVIVYGKPVTSVNTNGYNGNWTNENITFTLSATNALNGLIYYYKTDSNNTPTLMDGNVLTVQNNTNDVYYFSAVNSEGVEGEFTIGYAVKRDDITPTFTLEPTVTTITNQSYSVNLQNVTVGLSGIASITVNDVPLSSTDTSFLVEKNGTYTVIITANNGLSSTQTIEIQNIDKEAPEVMGISMAHKENGKFARFINTITFGHFFNQKVEITISAEDKGVAGLDRIEYRFLDENGIPKNEQWQVYDANNKPLQAENFKGYVEARAIDKATNLSDVLRSDGYVIDSVNPSDIQMTATYQGKAYTDSTWVAGDVNITLASTAFSGIYEYCYRIDGGEWRHIDGNTFTATEVGDHLYEFKAVSYSALESVVASIRVKIDRQTPVVRVDFEGAFGRWTGEGVKFSLHTEEASLSGITYYYENGNGWTRIATGEEIVIEENVNAVYRFKAVNGAGTESYPSDSYKVMVDIETPTLMLTPAVTEMTDTPYAISVATTTGASGLKAVYMNGEDITGKDSVTIQKNGMYVFTAVGNNGKLSTKTLEVSNFYPDVPILQVQVQGTVGTVTNQDVIFTLSTPNMQTGVQYYYSIGTEWVLLDSNVLTVSENGSRTYRFKAVSQTGKESAVSPEYAVNIDKNLELVERTPNIFVMTNGTVGSYTSQKVTFTLSSTNCVGEVTYYYNDGSGFKMLSGNVLTIDYNVNADFVFKVMDSTGKFSTETPAFKVQIDKNAPAFTLMKEQTTPNAPYDVQVAVEDSLSGVASITVNGVAVIGEKFTVDKNGMYIVTVVGNNGLSTTKCLEELSILPPDLVGDINADGNVSIEDYAVVQSAAVGGIDTASPQYAKCDVNQDGIVDALDTAQMDLILYLGQ